MGIVKASRPIHNTLAKAIAYIINDAKTKDGTLVSGFDCNPQDAAVRFQETADLQKHISGRNRKLEDGKKEVVAYHWIQSFDAEDNLTPEEIHEIGMEWAHEVLGDRFEFILATHVNTENPHNHLIFNAVSYADGRKFHSQKNKTIAFFRAKNDEVRRRYGLQITVDEGKAQAPIHPNPKSYRSQLRTIINETIRHSADFQDFRQLMQEQGVEIKEGKYLSFRMSGQQRFVRDKTLGDLFSKAAIIHRIDQKNQYANRVHTLSRSKRISAAKDLADALFTMRREDIEQFSDFDLRISALRKQAADTKADISKLNDKIHQAEWLVQVVGIYQKYKPLADELESKTVFGKKAFQKTHSEELKLFQSAKAKLEQQGISLHIRTDALERIITRSEGEADDLHQTLENIENRIDRLVDAQNIVDRLENGEEYVFIRHQKQDEQEKKKHRTEDYSL